MAHRPTVQALLKFWTGRQKRAERLKTETSKRGWEPLLIRCTGDSRGCRDGTFESGLSWTMFGESLFLQKNPKLGSNLEASVDITKKDSVTDSTPTFLLHVDRWGID